MAHPEPGILRPRVRTTLGDTSSGTSATKPTWSPRPDAGQSWAKHKAKSVHKEPFMAAATGDVKWLEQSLRAIGNQLKFDDHGMTVIHIAARHGHMECLQLCLDKLKFNINTPSETGWRAVHLVIRQMFGKKSVKMLTYLIEKNADTLISNNDGITPLHQAAIEGDLECVKLLLQHHGNLFDKDWQGHTPLDLAKIWARKDCARLLANEMWNAKKNCPSNLYCKPTNVKILNVTSRVTLKRRPSKL